MSTPPSNPPPTSSPAPARPTAAAPPGREMIIYGHTILFYYWPVWACGFLFGALTWMSEGRAAIVPAGSYYDKQEKVIKLPPGKEIPMPGTGSSQYFDEGNGRMTVVERVHPSKNYGVIYAVALFVVILITNVPMRGVSSAVFISILVILTLAFALLGWWDNIFDFFGRLSIHLNSGFYFFFSTVLFIAWAIVFFVYDRMSYWRVTPGQITHGYVFGGGETSFDTMGMTFRKLRDDLFRHWILGFGSGDMQMIPAKAVDSDKDELQIHNVLFISRKLEQIQHLISMEEVT
jgi:hypothetical protein